MKSYTSPPDPFLWPCTQRTLSRSILGTFQRRYRNYIESLEPLFNWLWKDISFLWCPKEDSVNSIQTAATPTFCSWISFPIILTCNFHKWAAFVSVPAKTDDIHLEVGLFCTFMHTERLTRVLSSLHNCQSRWVKRKQPNRDWLLYMGCKKI